MLVSPSDKQTVDWLHPHIRWTVAVVGLGAIGLCILTYSNPPRWRLRSEVPIAVQSAPRQGSAASNCDSSDQFQSDPTVFCTGLLTAGSLLLIIAANGRRVSKFGTEGVEFAVPSEQEILGSETAAQDPSTQGAAIGPGAHAIMPPQPRIAPARGASRTFQHAGATYHIYRPVDIPADVLHAAAAAFPTLIQSSADLDYAFAKASDQRTDWFVRTRAGQPLRL